VVKCDIALPGLNQSTERAESCTGHDGEVSRRCSLLHFRDV